jgi:hypothetical protein
VKNSAAEQQAIIDAVVLTETFAQKEQRVNRAEPVENDSDQEISSVRQRHEGRVVESDRAASGKSDANVRQAAERAAI